MSYPKTGEEVYVSLNLSNTMLTGIGKGTITREEVSADYLKRLFARYGVIVSAKPEQRRLLELVNDNFDLGLEIPETLKLFQLSEQHRRLVVINVQGLRRKNGSLLPEYTEEEFNEATFIFVKYRRLNGATAPITAEGIAYNPAPAGQNKVRLCGLTLFFARRTLAMSKNCTNDGCSCTPNMSIKCSVTSCAHHCQDMDNCGLSSIQVGTHEAHPSMDQCTDCQSFRKI